MLIIKLFRCISITPNCKLSPNASRKTIASDWDTIYRLSVVVTSFSHAGRDGVLFGQELPHRATSQNLRNEHTIQPNETGITTVDVCMLLEYVGFEFVTVENEQVTPDDISSHKPQALSVGSGLKFKLYGKWHVCNSMKVTWHLWKVGRGFQRKESVLVQRALSSFPWYPSVWAAITQWRHRSIVGGDYRTPLREL